MPTGPKTKLTLEQYTQTLTGTRAVTETWTKKREITGVLTTVKGDEQMSWDKKTVWATHRFRIDFPAGITITAKDRFTKSTSVYKIKFVDDPDAQKRTLTIMLEKTT